MRINRLVLERYGRFTGRELVFKPAAPLHVVLGANEAGKTTALAAIADLLFGFGHQTSYDFQHDGKSLRIGAELKLGNGKTLTFRRRKGNKNTLIDAGDQPLADDLLSSVTGSLTRETFCREFGLTADALRKGGEDLLKAGGRLAETLAAGSAGLSALSALRATLSSEADALFTPRKSAGKDFYVAVDRYAAADSQLRAAIVTIDTLKEAEDKIAALRQQKDDLGRQHESAERDLRRLERCARTRNGLARLDDVLISLGAFGDLPQVPAQLVLDWRTALNDDHVARQALQKLEADDASDLAAIEALGVDETLLASGSTIDGLRERLGAIRKAIEDLPRRQEAQRLAAAELDDLARRLGFSSHNGLLARRPTDPALAKVRELIMERSRADERLAETLERLRKATEDRDALQSQAGSAAHPTDPAVFRQRLEAVAHVPGQADRLLRESHEIDGEYQSLVHLAHSLNPPVESPEVLSGLPVPDETEIAAQVRVLTDLDGRERDAGAALSTAGRLIRERTAEITRLTRDGVRATRADLAHARQTRDAAFDVLHTALDGGAAARKVAFDNLRAEARTTDEVTDQLLSDSDRAARLQAAEDQRADADEQSKLAAETLETLARSRAQCEAHWLDLWSATGLTPRAPSDMVSWRQKAQAILDRCEKLQARRTGLAVIAQGQQRDRSALATLMADFGRMPSDDAPAETLYREAGQWLSALQDSWSAAREREVMLKAAAASVKQAEDDASAWRANIAAISHQWPAAVGAIGLKEVASPAEAKSALEVWQGVGEPLGKLNRETRSVEGIEADIASFTVDVAEVARRVAPGSTADAPSRLLPRLADTLAEARNAASQRKVMQQATANRQSTRAGLQSLRRSLAGTLDDARKLLGTADDASLASAVERLERRRDLEALGAKESASLKDSADGLDEASLRAEQSDIDPDGLQGAIDRRKAEIGPLLKSINDASVALAEAGKNYEALTQGRDAAGAAREREEASAEILAVTRRWLVRAAAARLAGLAIERHRDVNQDPLLARAGTLFQAATAEGFTGLAADYDDQDRPTLVAVRASGERVPVVALSEGTRDQLFLALRLALLGLRAADPLPFIADDLLSSFDDERTKRVLALLADFGQRSQVIVFTHHAHVAELARQAVPGADVLPL